MNRPQRILSYYRNLGLAARAIHVSRSSIKQCTYRQRYWFCTASQVPEKVRENHTSSKTELKPSQSSVDEAQRIANANLERYAQEECAPEQYELGSHYFHGTNGYKVDYNEARLWVGRSAAQGYTDAEALMGKMLLYGKGVKKDLRNAFRHFVRCASRGHVEAMASLGNMLLHGLGTDQDHNEAIKWLRKAVQKGDFRAMRDLGFIYAEGTDQVKRDLHIATRLAESVGSQTEKEPSAQRLAATLHIQQNDREMALYWYRRAANGGDLEAQASLGQLLLRDIDVSTEETHEGARWLQKSADLGHKRAQRDLGFLFVDGRADKGIEPDCKKGVFYLLTAGLFGMPDAYLRAAEVLVEGAPRYPNITADFKAAKSHVKEARKTARENEIPTLPRKLWHRLFEDPKSIRELIDKFELDPETGISRIQKTEGLEEKMGTKVDRMFDPNHTAKAAVPRLVNAQKGRSVIKAKFKQNVPKKVFYHTSKLLLLACKSNRNNPEGAREAINAIPKHLSGDHRSCGSTWGCKSKSHKSTVKFKLIKSDSRILQKFWISI
eukprot:900268_1